MISKRAIACGCGAAFLVVVAMFATRGHTADATSRKSGERYTEQEKVDPIKANGAIFVNWPKPDVALVFSGEQHGYLEPCGCAGLENQKGGLMRRATLFKELEAKGWPLVAMDVGGQEKRTGVQAEMKLDFSYRALQKLGYAAVGFGPEDLPPFDGPTPIIEFSKDLAFELYTRVPEPTTGALLMIAIAGYLGVVRRKR